MDNSTSTAVSEVSFWEQLQNAWEQLQNAGDTATDFILRLAAIFDAFYALSPIFTLIVITLVLIGLLVALKIPFRILVECCRFCRGSARLTRKAFQKVSGTKKD